MLAALGWDIQTAQDVGLTGKIDDVEWVIHSRKVNRIAITFDELKAEQGVIISRELRRRGGKIVRVNGRLNDYKAIGKILYHFLEWYPFLIENDGVAVLGETKPQGCTCYTPEEYHQHYHLKDSQKFASEYLKNKKIKNISPKKKRQRKPPPENQSRF